MTENPDKSVRKGVSAALSGLLLFLVAKLGCCGLPALAALLGALGVSSSFLDILKPMQPVFIFLAISGITYSLFKIHGPRKKACDCQPSRFSVAMTWVCAVFVVAVLAKQVVAAQAVSKEPCPCSQPEEPTACCPEAGG